MFSELKRNERNIEGVRVLTEVIVLAFILLFHAPMIHAQENSKLWGNHGENWKPGSPLQDFTNPGYHEGKQIARRPSDLKQEGDLVVAPGSILPGKGLDQHDFLYAGESKNRRAFIIRKGQVVWSYDDPAGRGEISDAVLLSNGNLLLAHQHAVKLISPEKQVLWKLDAPQGTEIHTAMPIGFDHVLYVQNGNPAMVKVVNITTNKTVREFPLPVGNPKNTHGHFRHARITPAGTLLVAHMDMGKVCEYNAEGKEVWSYAVASPWGAKPLGNGNVLITSRGDVREVTPSGETVYIITPEDSPDHALNNLQLAWRLPNGNTLVNNWFNEWSGQVDKTNPPVQAVEFTPDKKVVWVLKSWTNPDLGPSTTIQILEEPDALENVYFGDIN